MPIFRKGGNKKRLLVGGLIVLVLLFLAAVIGFKVTDRPGFCTVCHIMKPYVSSWKESSHRGIKCGECHYPPGFTGHVTGKVSYGLSSVYKQITGKFGHKPIVVDIRDGSCLNKECHHKVNLARKKVLYEKGILFDHRIHFEKYLEGKKVRCTTCHNQTRKDVHMEVTGQVCILCHFKSEPEKITVECRKCHALPGLIGSGGTEVNHIQIAAEETNCTECHGQMKEGKGEAGRQKCLNCHKQEDIEKDFETAWLHEVHVSQRTIYCLECHQPIKHETEK